MSDKLRVVEVYASYQGEGPNTSRPTVFVRFAGCNLKCPLWPCDTQHAIDPAQFTKLQRFVDPDTLADEVFELGISNICLTGGEVFLQKASALAAFIAALKADDAGINVECFTNGTLLWDTDVSILIDNFIVDWKLPGSGEAAQYDDNESWWGSNFAVVGVNDAIKFTIANRADYHIAKERYTSFIEPITLNDRPKVYCGIVWNNTQVTTEQLCGWMIEDKLDWNLNVQVHKYVWHPDKIGV